MAYEIQFLRYLDGAVRPVVCRQITPASNRLDEVKSEARLTYATTAHFAVANGYRVVERSGTVVYLWRED